MQIKVFSGFSKRINSTKQPTGGTTVDVLLKDACSILNPTFILNTLDFSINYVQAFGNYYFCDVRNLDGHRSELNCSLDHLATFKTQIAGYTGLVEYTSSSSNVKISDPRNMPTMEMGTSEAAFSWKSGQGLDASAGTFILSFLSDEASLGGICKYVALDWYGLSQFSYEFFSHGIVDEIQKQFNNTADALVSLMWLPLNYDDLPGTVTSTFTVGHQAITLSDSQGKIITNRVYDLDTNSPIDIVYPSYVNAPNLVVHDTYLELAPYMTAEMFLPYVGCVPFSDDIIGQYHASGYITLTGSVDILTGDIVYLVKVAGHRISTFSGNIATHLPIGSASYNAFGVASGAVTVAGGVAGLLAGLATGGSATALMAAGGAILGGAASAAKSTSIHTQINGANSSAIGQKLGTTPMIILSGKKPINNNLLAYQAEQGMPYYQVATLGNLSGYIKCNAASVSIPGDGSEQNTVNGYLNSGFYYE